MASSFITTVISEGALHETSDATHGDGVCANQAELVQNIMFTRHVLPESIGHHALFNGAILALLGAAFTWSYWTTLVTLVGEWSRQPDYSHGFFVAPLAVYFLWARRDSFPGLSDRVAWLGLIVIGVSVAMRFAGAHYYMDALDGWSILLWVAGVVWLLWGGRVLAWSLPSILFLWFMVPLPYRIERAFSLPLQSIATKISCAMLQMLGQPAVSEGNTILLGTQHLEVEQACSGLRTLVGILALAFGYVVLAGRAWWEHAILLLSVVPIALAANALRIVATGLLYRYVSGEAAQRFSRDAAGWVMILLAAAMFSGVLWYLTKLTREVESLDMGAVVRRAQRLAKAK